MLTTAVVDGPDWSDKLREPWKELFQDCQTATPFQSWEWQATWARHFLRSQRPRIFIVREGQDLIGLFPMTLSRRAWRSLRPMGLGLSDYLHPLIRTGSEERAIDALSGMLIGQKDVDLVDLQQIRESHPLVAGREGLIEQAKCLVVDLPETFEEYLAQMGKNQRYKLSKLRRQTLGAGKATIEFMDSGSVDPFTQVLFSAHGMRWRKRLLPGVFVGRRRQTFHREFLSLGSEGGLARLAMLRVEGSGVGVTYCLRAGSVLYYYQAGFDPEYGRLSPGTLLLAETVRAGMEEGVRTFDLMRGDEPYKHNWKPTACYRNVRLLLPATGLRASAGHAISRRASRIEARLRERFEGKGLLS